MQLAYPQPPTTSGIPIPDHLYRSNAKRRKHSHQPDGFQQPILRREEPAFNFQDREDYWAFPSHPSSSRSSPLHPTTPDQSQSSDHSAGSNESQGWPILTRLDEIELLSVIEKQAETYSCETGHDELPLPPSPPPFGSIHYHNHEPFYPNPSLIDPQSTKPPTTQPVSLPSNQPPPPTIPPNSQDNKRYKCSLCPKAFTRNYDLTRHKSSHQDQRPHICQKCGRSFNRRDALIRHTLVRGCNSTQ